MTRARLASLLVLSVVPLLFVALALPTLALLFVGLCREAFSVAAADSSPETQQPTVASHVNETTARRRLVAVGRITPRHDARARWRH